MEYLFTVEDTFWIADRGLVLTSGLRDSWAKVGEHIQLNLPDKSIIKTKITGIHFHEKWAILVEKELKKEDVPIGTEVWLCN